MFVTTEPVPGEKLKIGMFSSKVMSKFVDICDEVRKMRLCIALLLRLRRYHLGTRSIRTVLPRQDVDVSPKCPYDQRHLDEVVLEGSYGNDRIDRTCAPCSESGCAPCCAPCFFSSRPSILDLVIVIFFKYRILLSRMDVTRFKERCLAHKHGFILVSVRHSHFNGLRIGPDSLDNYVQDIIPQSTQ